MKAAEGKVGRVFVIRLEDEDVIPDCLEAFAKEKGVKTGLVTMIGGVSEGNIVTGPRKTGEMPPDPLITPVEEAHETIGLGVIALDENECPKLHLHGALGRTGSFMAGCFRPGLKTWLVGEVIITEITGIESRRVLDEKSGFALLRPYI
ncbi:MAG: PPC domain-containing DNA-binding protein [Bacillota bacterium]